MTGMSVKDILLDNVTNIPGWRTRSKIVVFESDDWGSMRMPSKHAYESLLKAGIRVDKSKYDSLDSLENGADLTNLLDLLSEFKGSRGEHPVFTFNTVMANPNFKLIEDSRFLEYHFDFFFDSYKKYYGEDLKSVWFEGINKGLIKPQFHAREHVNLQLWIRDLLSGNKDTLSAFQREFFGLKTRTSSSLQNHYLAAFCAETKEELDGVKEITRQGLQMFRDLFGFSSKSFIACNYIWPKKLEPSLSSFGIEYMQGQRVQKDPFSVKGKIKTNYHYTGQKSGEALYLVRNVLFEPFFDSKRDWVNACMKQISNAFFWGKPAVISSHRINYVSNMDVRHRDRNLNMLRSLIDLILKKWPDTQFVSSDQLGDLIITEN